MRAILAAVALAVGATVAAITAAPPEIPLSPADVLLLCHEDLYSVDADTKLPIIDPEKAKTTRWISLHNLEDDTERDLFAKVISGHVNGLSRKANLVVPVRVGKYLLRIDTLNYGPIFTEQWERLGDVEPYWHDFDERPTGEAAKEEFETVEVEIGFWTRNGVRRSTGGGSRQFPDEVWEKTGTTTERRPKKVVDAKTVKVKGFGYWTQKEEKAKEAFAALQAKLGGTNAPVVTAEWLLYQTAIQKGRKPGYYDFNGIKDLKTFEEAIGFVRKGLDPEFLRETKEAIGQSGVTTEETKRRIIREQASGSGYWYTLDSNLTLAKKNAGKANPTEYFGDDLEFDAFEGYGPGANRLWKTIAANAAGATVEVVPADIATDSTNSGNDRNIHPNLSCLRCHNKGGLKDFEGWVTNFANLPPNALGSKDPKEAIRIREQYVERRLEPHIEEDRERYEKALFTCTGMKSDVYATAYGDLWHKYAEKFVDLQRAARDLGCTPQQFLDGLEWQAEKRDLVLAAFRVPNGRISVFEWHQKYRRAQDAVNRVNRPFAIKEKVK